MQYRKSKDGQDISLLGYGCMRFTRSGSGIDIDKATKEIEVAYNAGVNYYDTAYVYPGSEEALGEALSRLGIRDKVFIASKLPHYLVKSVAGAEKMFQEELRRLKTDHIDFYLMHMLTDLKTWNKLLEMGIGDWIKEKLESGAIRRIGFSYHGTSNGFIELVDAYDWDFCQIQYNYLDENSQAGVKGLKHANEKGLPVIIMEGLRGGRLVNDLPNKSKERIAAANLGSAAALAFKWLYTQPEVTCVLSGMNSVEMVEENIKTVENAVAGSLTDAEKELIEAIKADIADSMKVGCTGCAYCMPCPQNVDIPGTFSCYNKLYSGEKKASTKREYLQNTVFRQTTTSASQCVGCGKCEQHCPQHLPIRQHLKEASKELETFQYKAAKKLIKAFKLW